MSKTGSVLWLLALIPAAIVNLAFVAMACLAYPLFPRPGHRRHP